jgi:hypothetical protein
MKQDLIVEMSKSDLVSLVMKLQDRNKYLETVVDTYQTQIDEEAYQNSLDEEYNEQHIDIT